MKIRKMVICVTLAGLLAGAMTGCSAVKKYATADSVSTDDAKTTVSVRTDTASADIPAARKLILFMKM